MQIKNTNEFDDILFNILGFEMQISEAQKSTTPYLLAYDEQSRTFKLKAAFRFEERGFWPVKSFHIV